MNRLMLSLLDKYVSGLGFQRATCVKHNAVHAQNFKEARKCKNLLDAYRNCYIDKYVCNSRLGSHTYLKNSLNYLQLSRICCSFLELVACSCKVDFSSCNRFAPPLKIYFFSADNFNFKMCKFKKKI